MKPIGTITHYFDRIGVAIIELTDRLKEGDEILIQGGVTNFRQRAESMQIQNQAIEEANAGQSIGMKTSEKVRKNDKVYRA